MKTRVVYLCLMLLSTITILSSCKKETASTPDASDETLAAAVVSTGAIAIAPLAGTFKNGTDSLYLVNCYSRHSKKNTVDLSTLPSTIGAYLTANYSGYTFAKAYKITDSLNVINSYIVVIRYNKHFVGLKFSSTGTFINVLEQRAGEDLMGKGWHKGGPFDDRDGKDRDTVALSAIPSAVTTFFTTNYPNDILMYAYLTPDTSYILISKDVTSLYVTDITSAGALVKRIKIWGRVGHKEVHTVVSQANLLNSISTYLTTTYPGYVFKKAYAESTDNVITEYDVFIKVNNTNYVIDFNATGAFVKATAIH